jgi:hypothetical protein
VSAGGVLFASRYCTFVQAIVSAIDEPWRERIRDIWGEAKAVLQLPAVTGVLEPRLAYHLAQQYDPAAEAALGRIAADHQSFSIRTHGLGVLRGERTVIYLHVTLDDPLVALHRRIVDDIAAAADGAVQAYAQETWLPHIRRVTRIAPVSTLWVGRCDARDQSLTAPRILNGRPPTGGPSTVN